MALCRCEAYIGGMTETLRRVGIGVIAGIVALVIVRVMVGTIWGVLSFLVFLFNALAIFDAVTSRRSAVNKVLWVVAILLVPFLGALLYWIVAREP